MRLLDRYIIRTIAGSVAMVLGVLLTLIALFLFIGQQPEVGTGSYGGLQALQFVLFNLPEQFFQFLPVAALMGALLGMGMLARGSELTVMRASGVSILRIGVAMGMAGVALMAMALLVGEFIAPAAGEFARAQKAIAKFSNISFAGRGGAWARDGQLILKAEQQTGDGALGGITVFEMSGDNRLTGVGHASRGVTRPEGGWELQEYSASRFEGSRVQTQRAATQPLTTVLSAAFLGLAASDPADLSMRELRGAIGYLRANGQETRAYRFAFWSLAARIVAIPFAVLLALPFLFGSLRSSGNGARATLGLVLGLTYFIMQRMVESGTIAFSLDPFLLAWLPTAILAIAVVLLIWRMRIRIAA